MLIFLGFYRCLRGMRLFLNIPIAFILTFGLFFNEAVLADYVAKVKEITVLKGVKKNQIYGYGLVVGLNGTGDGRSMLTRKTIGQYLSFAGIEMDEKQLDTANAAVVAVSAELSGLIEKGDLVDIQVASIGGARSIENGLLIRTYLKAGNGQTYVVAGGVVGTGSEKQPRRGLVPGGGIVEKSAGQEVGFVKENQPVELLLKNPSLTMASSLKESIENANPEVTVNILDFKQINLVGKNPQALSFKAISEILNLSVPVESSATIVIDRQTGVVVGGQNVRVDTSFISLPGLQIIVKEGERSPLSGIFKGNTTVNDLATEFNSLGIKPNEMVSIFTALKKAGALNADIVVQ